MMNLQQRLEVLTKKAATLVAQVDELNKLRDKIKRTELSIRQRPQQPTCRKKIHIHNGGLG